MNDIIGILIPLLMSGAGIGEIVRALGGAGNGAASSDGLSRMVGESLGNARMSFWPKHNEFVSNQVSRASGMLVDRMGIDPTSGLGQGLTSLLGGLYHLAPDTMGAMLGVPNGGQFFGTIANGASGINRAAGFGQTDIFNPYSVMASHERTMKMAETAYGLGVRKDGGYNIGFSHGLNMEEMGKVTQRLLSSDVAFNGDNGERFEHGTEKFKERLEKLGSKFNEAASMLSKITGSIDESIKLMDRLGGGNFLGGTEAQATEVASRAKKMATAIRVTSAIAGISPQEAYANMKGLQSGMATGMGMNAYVAAASGFSDLMQGMAFNGTMGYNSWAAMNPDATPTERQRALFAANGRAQSYATSNGAAFAAAVADNARQFSKEELENIKSALREGRPEDVVDLVKGKIGSEMYNEYMTDKALQVAARKRASDKNPDLLNDIDQAGMEGNLAQAEQYGTRRILRKTLSDVGSKMSRLTGDSSFSKNINDAATDFLRTKAKEAGLSDDDAASWSAGQLKEYITANGVSSAELERQENLAKIGAAKKEIDERTMTEREEKDAGNRLLKEINSSSRSEEKKIELRSLLEKGKIDEAFIKFSAGMSGEVVKDLRKNVYGEKITRAEADKTKYNLDRIERSQNDEFTADERMRAIENDINRSSVENMGRLKGEVARLSKDDVRNMRGDEAIKRFSEVAKESGAFKGSDEDLEGVFGKAANRVVSNILKDKFGNLEGKDLDKLKSDMAGKLLEGMKSGKTIQEAFADVKGGLSEEQQKILDKVVNDKNLSNEAFLSAAASEIDSKNSGEKKSAFDEMKKLLNGDFGKLKGRDVINSFAENLKKSGAFKGSDEELQKITEDAYSKLGEGGSEKDAISGMLEKAKPKGIKDKGFYATAAAGGMNQAALVMAASMLKRSGLTMSQIKLIPGMEDLVSAVDDASADSIMNRIPNAIQVGGASFTKEAVESTKKRVAELGDILTRSGIDEKDIAAMSGSGKDAEAARNKVQGALEGRSDIKYDMDLIESISSKSKVIGGERGVDVLLDSKKREKANKADGSEEDYANVTKEANRKNSDIYGILNVIGGLATKLGPLLEKPEKILQNASPIKVLVTNDVIKVD